MAAAGAGGVGAASFRASADGALAAGDKTSNAASQQPMRQLRAAKINLITSAPTAIAAGPGRRGRFDAAVRPDVAAPRGAAARPDAAARLDVHCG